MTISAEASCPPPSSLMNRGLRPSFREPSAMCSARSMLPAAIALRTSLADRVAAILRSSWLKAAKEMLMYESYHPPTSLGTLV